MFLESFVEGFLVMRGHINVQDGVNRMTAAIWSFGAVGEDTSKTCFVGIVGLVHVDCKVILFANACKINA